VLDVGGALPGDLQVLAGALPPVEAPGGSGTDRIEAAICDGGQRGTCPKQVAAMQPAQRTNPSGPWPIAATASIGLACLETGRGVGTIDLPDISFDWSLSRVLPVVPGSRR
jgi:hypothetical protein